MDLNPKVFLCGYNLHGRSVHGVGVLLVVRTKVEYMALVDIKQHLPLRGPVHQVVNVSLQGDGLRIVVDFPYPLGVVGKLVKSSGGGVNGQVNVVDVEQEQERPDPGTLGDPRSDLLKVFKVICNK